MAPHARGPSPARPNGTTVLVVDDAQDVRDLLRRALEVEGYVVECAADCDEALARLRRPPAPAAVLLDLNMPHLDAYGFRAQQRRDPALHAIPVILYSGAADLEKAAQALGVEAWISKPFDFDRLLDLLERWARRGAGSAP